MSILGEIVVQLLGEATIGVFTRNKKPRPPFAEGGSNASLGAVALFAAFLSLIFSLLPFMVVLDHQNYTDLGPGFIIGFSVFSILSGLLAFRSGRKAPHVTRRNLGMAAVGAWLSVPAMALSVLAVLICLIGMAQWTL
jgi:hypothetical protein